MSNLLLGVMLRKFTNMLGVIESNNNTSDNNNNKSGHGEHKNHEPEENSNEENSNEENSNEESKGNNEEICENIINKPIPNIDYLIENVYYPFTYFGSFPSNNDDKNKLKKQVSSLENTKQELKLINIGSNDDWNKYVNILYDAVDALNCKFAYSLITDLYEYMLNNNLTNETTPIDVLDLDMFFLLIKDFIKFDNNKFTLLKYEIMKIRPQSVIYHYTLYHNLSIIEKYYDSNTTEINVYEQHHVNLNTRNNNNIIHKQYNNMRIPTADRGVYIDLSPIKPSFVDNNYSEIIINKPFNNNIEIINNIMMTLGLFIGGFSPLFFETVYYLTQFRHKTKNLKIVDSLMRIISGWYLENVIEKNRNTVEEEIVNKLSKWESSYCKKDRHEYTYKISSSSNNTDNTSFVVVNNCVSNILFQSIYTNDVDCSTFYGEFFSICFGINGGSFYKTIFFDIDINILYNLKEKLQNLIYQKDIYYNKLNEVTIYYKDDFDAHFDNAIYELNKIVDNNYKDKYEYLTKIFFIMGDINNLKLFQNIYKDIIEQKRQIINLSYNEALHVIEDIIVDYGSKYNEISTILLNNIRIKNKYAKKIYDNINNPNIIIPYKYQYGTYKYLYVLNLNLLGFDNLSKFMSYMEKQKYFNINDNYKLFIEHLYNTYKQYRLNNKSIIYGPNKIEKMNRLIAKLNENENRCFYFIMCGHSLNDLKKQFKYMNNIVNKSNKDKTDVPDPGLTNLGVQQSLSIRKRIQKRPIDFLKDLKDIKVVFTSFLQRSIQTAMISYSGTNAIIIPIPYIRDIDIGAKNRVNTKNLPKLEKMACKLGVRLETYFYKKHLRHNAGIVASMSGKRYALKLKNSFLRILLELIENVMGSYPLIYSKTLLRGNFVFFTHSKYADKALKLKTSMQLANITRFQYNLSLKTKCSIIHYRTICAPNNSISYVNTDVTPTHTQIYYSYYNGYIKQNKN